MSAATAVREVLCVTEHEHRDGDVAEGVLAGRFSVAGETRALGADVRWLEASLPADDEWRIEWVKFAWGLDLAHAGAQTGDPAYHGAWERLVRSWIDQVPSNHDAAEVAARRVLNWIYARQRFGSGGADFEAALRDSVAAQAAHVRAELAERRNHRTLELYALLIVALGLPEAAPAGLLDFAVDELDRNLREDFRADGVHVEASTHYHLIALRSFVGARENARRFGVTLPDGYDERLARACAFARACTRPDGTIPALSDSDTGDYRPLLALAADLLEEEELCPSFSDGGYFLQRSADGRFLVFDCGPLGDGGHGHYDLLSVEACAGDRLLVADPGRYTYAEGTPNLRHWFKGTAAHNTVCVDGLDQTPYAPRRPAGPVAEGRLLGRGSADGLDVVAGAAFSPVYDAVHERRVAFVDGAYWVIEDRLRAPTAHRYDLRWHLAPEALASTQLLGTSAGATVLAPGLALVVLGADAVRIEPGWVSPSYGVKLDAPVISACADASDVTFFSVLVPGESAPVVSRLGARTLRVDRAGVTDTIAFGDAGCRWRRGAHDIEVTL